MYGLFLSDLAFFCMFVLGTGEIASQIDSGCRLEPRLAGRPLIRGCRHRTVSTSIIGRVRPIAAPNLMGLLRSAAGAVA